MKIALVHDHLISNGGGERVLKAFTEVWPDAPIFTLLYQPSETLGDFREKDIHVSRLQHAPFGMTKYRWYLPLRPRVVEEFDLSGYDIVLSNSSAHMKGVVTDSRTLHINYCHTPTRYLWVDPQERLDALEGTWPVSRISDWYKEHHLRAWDLRAAQRVDRFIVNSRNVQDRVKKYYDRDSILIYPPVDTLHQTTAPRGNEQSSYFVIGGRLVPQKRYDIAIQAFNKLAIPLKVFGVGPEYTRLRALAGPTIEFLGALSEEDKTKLITNAQAFIYPQIEDFGITAVEAMSVGCPVIAYRAGGSLETIQEGVTGVFFDHQDWQALAYAVLQFNRDQFDYASMRTYAHQFSTERFKKEIKTYVENTWEEFRS